ncbi:MAG TPA: protein-disulfide reductase DsbD domain-containing protein [Candidatus Methylomirabilis sp.]|nr:protein-disulfide reductase DsbD domain-containing protein [Candidatus Methylomirabilis sp.]
MKNRFIKPAAGSFAGILVLAILAALPSTSQQVPNPKDVVSPAAFASLDPVGRGSAFQIAVVVKVRNGFHINAREKSDEYLIATDLQAAVPTGFKIGEVSYPKGQLHSFSFSKKPLNVYEGTITLRVPVTALNNAPLGEQHIPLKLRYQACNDELCLPPVKLEVDTKINVAAAASASRPAHVELFSSEP